MKRAAIIIAMLGIGVWGFTPSGLAQSKPAAQSAPAGQAAAPAGKRPPQAKTQEEFAAYKAAAALTDPAAQEKAADDFAAKFPESELRQVLYRALVASFQRANDSDKMLATSQKLLAIDPDDPQAL